ncbi:MAG: DUF3320 domain-containing protein, partial [Alphaproteobacteria bacterium]
SGMLASDRAAAEENGVTQDASETVAKAVEPIVSPESPDNAVVGPYDRNGELGGVEEAARSGGAPGPSRAEPLYARSSPTEVPSAEGAPPAFTKYRRTVFGDLAVSIDPSTFYDPTYSGVLRQLVARVLENEAPVSETMLVQRIARAHRFQRSGRLIRNRVMMVVEHGHHVSEERSACFVWQSADERLAWHLAREPATEDDIRQIEDIAIEELRAARGLGAPAEIARFFGVRRLSSAARERIVRAIS